MAWKDPAAKDQGETGDTFNKGSNDQYPQKDVGPF